MVEGNSGAGERVLYRGWDARGVSVGGDGDGATVVHADQRGADVLRDRVRIRTLGHMAVFDVPPHRYLGRGVLRLRVRRRSISAHDADLFSTLISCNSRFTLTDTVSKLTASDGKDGVR